jgi:hypothetical protein
VLIGGSDKGEEWRFPAEIRGSRGFAGQGR